MRFFDDDEDSDLVPLDQLVERFRRQEDERVSITDFTPEPDSVWVRDLVRRTHFSYEERELLDPGRGRFRPVFRRRKPRKMEREQPTTTFPTELPSGRQLSAFHYG